MKIKQNPLNRNFNFPYVTGFIRQIGCLLYVRQFMQKLFLSLLLLFAYSAVNAAEKEDYQAMYSRCLDAAGTINNNTVLGCSEKTSTAVKQEMNVLYRELYAKLASTSVEDAAKLEQSQKVWVSYRNKHCELATSYVGSPMYGVCPMGLNISRVEELRELAGK